MEIHEILDDKLFILDMQAKNKEDALKTIAGKFCSVYPRYDSSSLYNSLLERENKGTTGFGDEIAIPHSKMKGIENFHLIISKSKKGIPFDSVDKKKVKLFFTIIGPEDKPNEYIQILALVSRIARNNYAKDELIASKTPETLKENFLKYLPSDSYVKQEDIAQKKLMIITLYETNFYDEIIEILLSNGIKGVSTFETSGTNSILSKVPLFSQVMNFTEDKLENSQTILCIVDKSKIKNIVSDMENLLGNLDKVTGASIIALDLFYGKGSFEVL